MAKQVSLIQCNSCKKEVAKTPRLICMNPQCKALKWGHTDKELLKLGVSATDIDNLVTSHTIYCKNHGGLVAKTPARVCPKCRAKDFGYDNQEIKHFFVPPKPITQVKCRGCHNVVAKTPNHKCLVCTVHNWGYSQMDVSENKFDTQADAVTEINYAIEAEDIEKEYPDEKNKKQMKTVLQTTHLRIPQGQFVVVMGPSGCGKSTLLKCLNGETTVSNGKVKIYGQDLHKNYHQLKKTLGYVPQSDIVHKELTVEQSLYFAAKLRLPAERTEVEIQAKITEVLKSLKIETTDLRQRPIHKLSGGQLKRVSIAVELLNDPSILFLDEPTSPLDPETIDEFLKCIQALSREKGTTIIMVTHKPEDLKYADTLIFLGVKGYHTFFGAASEEDVCEYFNKKTIIEVYGLLGNDEKDVKAWYEKWYGSIFTSRQKANHQPVQRHIEDSVFRQGYWLAKRYGQIKLNDHFNMGLLMAQPIIIALLIAFIFDKVQISVLFLTAIAAIWFGVSNAAKEVVSELPIYKRERMFNLHIASYIFSKIFILSFIAFFQVLIFVGILYFRYQGSVIGIGQFPLSVLSTFYISVSATLLGLVLSAYFETTEKVMTAVPIFLMPQIMLAGIITKIDGKAKELLSYGILGRWGTELLSRVQDDTQSFKKVNPVDSTKRMVQSIWHDMPQVNPKTCTIMPDSTQAMKLKSLDLLDLYEKNLWGLFPSIGKNLMMITVLNLVCIALIIYFLKRYDNFKSKYFF
jgi:ABC transport system ATP-binding/permease protein